MTGTRGLRGLFRRQPVFDSALDAVEADVVHHEAEAHARTEVIPIPADTMVIGPEPEPEPEPEPLPHAGYAIGPQILTEHTEWRWLFPWPAPTETPPFGWVDVSDATRSDVEDFLGADFIEWLDDGRGVVVHVAGPRGVVDLAHMGDRITRGEDGLHVQCTRVFRDWETGEFKAVIEAGDAT